MSIVEAAVAAMPILARDAARTEQDRRVTDASLAAARAAGAFRLGSPHADGKVDLSTRVRVLAELGRGCPSTAWIAATTAETNIALQPALSGQVRAEVFADPDAVMCASARKGRADTEADGLRINGRWAYASGCEHATWALLVVDVHDRSSPTSPAVVVVPVKDLSIDRDWHMAGLSGTGSHTLVAVDVHVPAARVIDPARLADGSPDVAIALGLFAPLLGAARGAVDTVAAAMGMLPAPGPGYDNLSEAPTAQQAFAEAAHRVESAEWRMMRIAETLDTTTPTPLKLSRLRMDVISAVRECRRAFDDLLDLHGSSGFSHANPLQRFWRDFAVGSRHIQFKPYAVAQNYARLLLD